MVTLPGNLTKNHWIIRLKWVNSTIYKIYYNDIINRSGAMHLGSLKLTLAWQKSQFLHLENRNFCNKCLTRGWEGRHIHFIVSGKKCNCVRKKNRGRHGVSVWMCLFCTPQETGFLYETHVHFLKGPVLSTSLRPTWLPRSSWQTLWSDNDRAV